MGKITDIKDNLQSRALAILPTYSVHSYQVDIEKNKFKGNKPQLSVLAAVAAETDSLIGAFTLDHTFNYTYTTSYNAGAKSQLGDALQASSIQSLMDDILTTYTDVQLNKSNIDASVLIINDLLIESPEFIEEEKVIIIKWSVNVRYKTNV